MKLKEKLLLLWRIIKDSQGYEKELSENIKKAYDNGYSERDSKVTEFIEELKNAKYCKDRFMTNHKHNYPYESFQRPMLDIQLNHNYDYLPATNIETHSYRPRAVGVKTHYVKSEVNEARVLRGQGVFNISHIEYLIEKGKRDIWQQLSEQFGDLVTYEVFEDSQYDGIIIDFRVNVMEYGK